MNFKGYMAAIGLLVILPSAVRAQNMGDQPMPSFVSQQDIVNMNALAACNNQISPPPAPGEKFDKERYRWTAEKNQAMITCLAQKGASTEAYSHFKSPSAPAAHEERRANSMSLTAAPAALPATSGNGPAPAPTSVQAQTLSPASASASAPSPKLFNSGQDDNNTGNTADTGDTGGNGGGAPLIWLP